MAEEFVLTRVGRVRGDTGAVGKSAYQIAVDNGFVGTEEEWLASLKGEKGDKGDAGGITKVNEEDFNLKSDGELNLSDEIKAKLNNFDEDNKLKDEALSSEVTEKLAKIDVLESSNAGLNLFDKSRLIQGLFGTDGTDNPSTDANHTKFVKCKGRIAVKPNTTYTFNAESSKDVVVYILSFSSTTSGSGFQTIPYTFTTDANTNEIRFEMRTSDRIELSPSDITKIQLELGSQATSFVQSNGVSNEQLTHDVNALTEELGTMVSDTYSATSSNAMSGKAVASAISTIKNIKRYGSNSLGDSVTKWKDAPVGMTYYHYEGANTTTYDLPHEHCIVLVIKPTTSRGKALAFPWDFTDKRIFSNNLHDTWRGWNQSTT